MYIRRKVFSVALDEYGEERLFSTNEIINEDDYLDEVMYSDYDDYDMDERLFTRVTIDGKNYEFTMEDLKKIGKAEDLTPAQAVKKLRDDAKFAKKYKKSSAGLSEDLAQQVRTGRRTKIVNEKSVADLGVAGKTNTTSTLSAGGAKYTKKELAEGKKLVKAEQNKFKKNPMKDVSKYTESTPYHRENYYRNDAFNANGKYGAGNMERLGKFEAAANKAQRGRNIKRALTGRNAKIAYGVGAAAGLGYGGYRLYKNHKSQED